jgi:hypothetical protein
MAALFPSVNKSTIRRFAAALPTIVVGLGALIISVVSGFVGYATTDVVPVVSGATTALSLVSFAIAMASLPTAGLTGFINRPRALVPPPLRTAHRNAP